MRQYILAFDQGTTSSRAVLFDKEGTPVSIAAEEFEQIYPRPGWVEHDPERIWYSQVATVKAAMEGAGASALDIAAIGITNQRETTLVWERDTGRPLHNAIVWQCRRTAPMCAKLKAEGLEPLFRERTGLVLDPYFAGTKLAWLLEQIPGARQQAERGELLFGTIDSYLVWRLTGGRVHVTDHANASRTLLFNIHSLIWDDELLRVLNIPEAMLPEVKPNSGLVGTTTRELLGGEIPIAGMAGDQQAAAFGQACFERGMVKNTYGTGAFIVMNTGEEAIASRTGLLTTIAWVLDGRPVYALEGSVFVAGAGVQWLRDGLGLITSAAQSEDLAASVPDNGGVYFVPAFVGLGAPYWDPNARGAIIGITRGTTGGHIARATLEAICYQTRDVLEAMVADSHIPVKSLRVDGGAAANNLLCQLQADLLGVSVDRPKVIETTALGAAYLAGLAVGFWGSQEEIARHWKLDRSFQPSIPPEVRDESYAAWKRAIARSRGWLHHGSEAEREASA